MVYMAESGIHIPLTLVIVLVSFLYLCLPVPSRCQEDINFCDGVNCFNNGTCQDTTTGYVCNCTEDFTGRLCSEPVNQSCRAQLCTNGATCNNITRTISSEPFQVISSFNCTCALGYEGPLCQNVIDYCADLPCGARGSCESITATQTFSCSCEPGFDGTPCVNVNDCDERATCHNGGTCVDLISDYACNCTDGWTGPDCGTDIDECKFNPCQHGKCLNGLGVFRCDCSGTGYKGEDCGEQVNECDDLEPCKNGATCTDTEGSYNCTCTLGYKGKDCEIPDCDAGQCENGGTCRVDGTKWTCDCVQYYEGDQCEIPGPCLNQTCELGNTEECVQNITLGNYTCNCLDGWEGDTCIDDINECDLDIDICENGATCVNTAGSYNCSCAVGYTGRYCQTDIDDCVSHDCENNGLCEDLVNGFRCNCSATGYEGDKCTIDIDECQATPSPCTGNRNCINTDGSYKCKCKEGFIGAKCSKDPCLNTICQNGGQCNSSLSEGGIWEPTCSCSEGYEGPLCEKAAATTGGGELNIWYIIGPVIAVVLLIVIIGIVIFVMMARTKRATRGTYSPSRQETSGARVELGNVLKKPPEERLI